MGIFWYDQWSSVSVYKLLWVSLVINNGCVWEPLGVSGSRWACAGISKVSKELSGSLWL